MQLPLKNSRTALVKVEGGKGATDQPPLLPQHGDSNAPLCSAEPQGSTSPGLCVCVCVCMSALWPPPCTFSPNSQHLQLFFSGLPSAHWSPFLAQVESLGLSMPHGEPPPITDGELKAQLIAPSQAYTPQLPGNQAEATLCGTLLLRCPPGLTPLPCPASPTLFPSFP